MTRLQQVPQFSMPVSFHLEPVHTCQWQCAVWPANKERRHRITSSLVGGGLPGGDWGGGDWGVGD